MPFCFQHHVPLGGLEQLTGLHLKAPLRIRRNPFGMLILVKKYDSETRLKIR